MPRSRLRPSERAGEEIPTAWILLTSAALDRAAAAPRLRPLLPEALIRVMWFAGLCSGGSFFGLVVPC